MTGRHEVEEATTVVASPATTVRAVLLDALALPDWNPAFRAITGPAAPAVGVPYAIDVRGGLAGHFAYTRIEPLRVDTSWEVPGFRETGMWVLEPHNSGTVIRHSFRHSGPLAALLSRAYHRVAAERLERLSRRAS